ncbi:hypothetical protein [Ekhidna sp.]|uniref:hypothetical protein n=1 Tax=Ekhidna sp. TaxID=2608089 RepID=UPI003299193B
MKKITYMIMACLLFVACDNTNPLEDLGGAKAAFASWVSAPSGDLLVSDAASSVSWEFELIDGNGGNDVTSVAIDVTDGTNSGNLATVSSFSANSNGVQGASGSFSLTDIATALGVAVGTIGEGADFDFTITVTKSDGTTWGQANAGAASGYDPAVPFSMSTATETVSVASFATIDTYLNSGNVDTVFLEFANDFTSELSVQPTVTRISAGGNTDDAIGAVQVLTDASGADSVYYVSYTPGAAANDTINIVVAGASAFATGFVMTNDTTEMVYIIDNANPTIAANGSSEQFGTGGASLGYEFNLVASETIGWAVLDVDWVDVGTTDSTVKIDGDDTAVLNYMFDWAQADGAVTLTMTVYDLAGNSVAILPVVLN